MENTSHLRQCAGGGGGGGSSSILPVKYRYFSFNCSFRFIILWSDFIHKITTKTEQISKKNYKFKPRYKSNYFQMIFFLFFFFLKIVFWQIIFPNSEQYFFKLSSINWFCSVDPWYIAKGNMAWFVDIVYTFLFSWEKAGAILNFRET